MQEAQTSIFGGEVAAPVFSALAALALRYEHIPPPTLVQAAKSRVPDLSPSALNVDGEGPALGPKTAQG